jgi:ribosomal protein S27AE
MSDAPWTQWQMESIKAFQSLGTWHPFTCGNDFCSEDHREGLLVERTRLYCPHCGYTQTWVHDFMANWHWIFIHASGNEYQAFKDSLGYSYVKESSAPEVDEPVPIVIPVEGEPFYRGVPGTPKQPIDPRP